MTAVPSTLDRPRRVILVDDTPDIRFLVRMALEREGEFRVVGEADDGDAGVELAAQVQPDIVLLDIAMPAMDGLQALPLIKSACPNVTVIMLSGVGSGAVMDEALREGADGYIQKSRSIKAMHDDVRAIDIDAHERRGARAGLDPSPS